MTARPEDEDAEARWQQLQVHHKSRITPSLMAFQDAGVITGWGYPFKDGKPLVPIDDGFGWSPPHLDHVAQMLRDGAEASANIIQSEPGRMNALITFPGGYTYGHWFVDMLPRIETALTFFSPSDLSFIVPGPVPSWAPPLLNLYGLGPQSLTPLGECDLLHCKRLIIPHFGRYSDYLPEYPHKLVFDKLKRFSLGNSSGSSCSSKRILVRHSPQTSLGHRAVLSNADELSERLARLGISSISPINLSRDEQISSFKNANIIIGEDSSALHNIIYSTDADLIVIGSHDRINLLHLSICKLLGHRCFYMFCNRQDNGTYACDLDELCRIIDIVDRTRARSDS